MAQVAALRNDVELFDDELERHEAAVARDDLFFFITKAWQYVEPNLPFVSNWHIHELCRILERVTRGELRRLVVNVPPGSMKSLLISVFWPAWEWASNPSLRYICASYGAHLSTRDNKRLRDLITSEWYRKYFKLELSDDQNQKTRFNTTASGWRLATSVGGVATGEHPDRIIIDDPLNPELARSDAERATVNTWFAQTISTRGVSRDVAIIIVMQRLHMEDLSGYLLNLGGWEHICWPMRYEKRRVNEPKWKPDPRDPRRTPGELLWPALFDESKVRQLELDLGPYGTAGQLQQRPAPEGGGLFRREWFKFVDAVPTFARRVRGWDTAASEGKGDYTCGAKIAEVGGIFFVEDIVREQLSPAGVDALIMQNAQADGRGVAIREEREGGSAGKTVTAARAKMLAGWDYAEVQISGDKVTRVKPFRAQCEAGNVYLLRAPWNEAYIRELCDFPTAKHDDQVDASGCAFNAVLLEPTPVMAEPTAVGDAPSPWGNFL